MANFVGKWKQTKNDNMLEILKAMGVAEDKRAFIADNIQIEISHDGETYTLHTESGEMTCTNSCKWGEQFEYNTLTGAKLKMCLNLENDNRIASVAMDDIPIKISLEIKDGELFEHIDLGDCVGSRTYVRA